MDNNQINRILTTHKTALTDATTAVDTGNIDLNKNYNLNSIRQDLSRLIRHINELDNAISLAKLKTGKKV